MNYIVYVLSAIVIAIIGITGSALNSIVLFVMFKFSHTLLTPINIILINLTFQDLLMAILGHPVIFFSAFYGDWYWSHATCQWYAWMMSTLGLGSIGSLTMMAIERMIIIISPVKKFSIRDATILLGFVWIYAFAMSTPPLFGWGNYGYEAANISCSVSWNIHDDNGNNRSYIIFLFFFGLILPVFVIIICYSIIIWSLTRIKRRIGVRERRNRKTIIMVVTMIIAFLFSWTPYSILALAVQFYNYVPSDIVAILPTLFAKISICYNPIIYAYLNNQFLQSLKKICGLRIVNEKYQRKLDNNNTVNVLCTEL